ncbi:Fic family protein [Phytoactinopolyspora halotolerans]|uniref:Fic family protein n=1 Tax=Phytoactinopolyspora halotolerans TaxID=1981512 RepID=A0A6L9SCJ1_9ACTN|nr:Fic family protein [Phytoactinopolyspora halotolerans]NEE02288.1 Fic family protein [Phytoactinopolyspora halotolerans]
MQALVGIALGTQPEAKTRSPSLTSRRVGRPVDQIRVHRFEDLARGLRAAAPQSRPVDPSRPERYTYLPFFEAYFSNFIEGTEFDVDEAARIVFQGEMPEARPADAHDIIGTHRLLADSERLRNTGTDADDFIDLLKTRNAQIMEGRPEQRPGLFKQLANRAGSTYFVDPALVEGTLAAGFRLRDDLDTAWERAVYIAFVVAEVHPFNDGNGRTARAMMSAELEAGGQCHIVVPTVFRQDYLDGLRLLSRQDDPSVLIKAMRYAHDFTAIIDFSDYAEAKRQLHEAHAFEEPDSARRLRVRPR